MKRITGFIKKAATHPLAKGSVIVFAGSMAANIGSYLYHLVVGRILGPVQYGELAALLSLSYIFNVITVVLQTVVAKFVAEKTAVGKTGEIRSLVVGLTRLLGIGTIISIGILYIVAPSISGFLHIENHMVVMFLFAGIAFSFLGIVYASVLQGKQRFVEGMIVLNMNALLRLLAGFLAASFGVLAVLMSNTVAVCLATLVTLWMIRDIFYTKHSVDQVRVYPLFRASIWTFLSILGISVLNSQDVVVVKHFLPSLESGWYAALSTMGKIIFFASYSIAYVLLPIVSSRSAKGAKSTDLIYVSLGIVSFISIAITAAFFALPELSLQILYGKTYVGAATYLGLFGIFSSLYTLAYTIVTALLGLGKTSVWWILIGVALLQDVLLSNFHTGISSVISVNISVSATLVIALLLYYRHEVKDR